MRKECGGYDVDDGFRIRQQVPPACPKLLDAISGGDENSLRAAEASATHMRHTTCPHHGEAQQLWSSLAGPCTKFFFLPVACLAGRDASLPSPKLATNV